MATTIPEKMLVPPDAYSRGFSRDDTAVVLDHHLRRLARQEARCRAILGRLATSFLRRQGHHDLGFSRLDDYAKERLGISGRELQSMATVMNRAAGLPMISRAFERGEIGWAVLRLLVGVATPATEDEWLVLARGRTVRALTALIRGPGGANADADEGEDTVRFRLRCPRRVVALWRAVVELAKRISGAELTDAQAAEAIAAEGLSARTRVTEPWPDAPSPARREHDPDEMTSAFAAELDWNAIADAVPDDLLDCSDDDDPRALETRMLAVLAAMQRVDWQMGRLLRLFLDRRLYRLMLFPSGARYVTERLGISARKARALVALERRTWTVPALGCAYRAGNLSWVRALTVAPVLHERTAEAWVARATEVTVRRLADEVEWAMSAGAPFEAIAPPRSGDRLERQLCARPEWEWADAEIAFTGPADVVALLRTAVLAFARPADTLPGGLEKLLLHVKAEWEGQPRHRDPVFARDGWRCAIPVCTARRNLHDHHLLYRSRGGGNARENRITLCAWHHLRGIHAGRVRAWGRAPDAITWEIGVRTGRRPLLRLDGHRYAT